MIRDRNISWHEANQQYLVRAIAQVRREIERSQAPKQDASSGDAEEELPAMPAPAAIETLCSALADVRGG
jgi:hypothetical protein